MYDVLVGKQRALIFPVMCNGFVTVGYDANVATTDYGIWDHDGSFCFEAVITPYDVNGYPLPPKNGDLVITNFFDPITGQIVENDFAEMYFQKAGGWYAETYGSNAPTVLKGNNPHIGPYDGGSE